MLQAAFIDATHPVDVLGVDSQGWTGDPAVLSPVCKGQVNDRNSQSRHPDGSTNLSETPA